MKTLVMIVLIVVGLAFIVLSFVKFSKEWQVNPWIAAALGVALILVAQDWTHGFVKYQILHMLHSNAKTYIEKLNEFNNTVSKTSEQIEKDQVVISKRIADIDSALSILLDPKLKGNVFGYMSVEAFSLSDANRMMLVSYGSNKTVCCFMLKHAAIKQSVRITCDSIQQINVYKTVANVTTAVIDSNIDSVKNNKYTVTYITDINKTNIFERMTGDDSVFTSNAKTILIKVLQYPRIYYTDVYE